MQHADTPNMLRSKMTSFPCKCGFCKKDTSLTETIQLNKEDIPVQFRPLFVYDKEFFNIRTWQWGKPVDMVVQSGLTHVCPECEHQPVPAACIKANPLQTTAAYYKQMHNKEKQGQGAAGAKAE